MILMQPTITSRNNPTVKWLASLSEKKYRDASRSFICEGEKLFAEAAAARLPITHVVLSETSAERLLAFVETNLAADRYAETTVLVLSESCFEKISTEKSPQGLLVVLKYLDNCKYCNKIYKEEFFSFCSGPLLLLESLRDPGNVGAVLRTAAGLGMAGVVMTADCADIFAPKTLRAAMGGLFHLKVLLVPDLTEVIALLRAAGRRVFAAALSDEALSLASVRLQPLDAVVIGNEGQGISDRVARSCEGSVCIPLVPHTESLNAAVAAAIIIWEQMKERLSDTTPPVPETSPLSEQG